MAHILVVDDEKDLVWTVTQGLRFQGYAVSAAYDGLHALRQVQAQPPDLILLDIVMPGMDGVEVCHRLRMNPGQGTIPVIFLTARFELQNKIAAFTAGADDYICKPFDMRELIARVQAVLRRRSYADTGAQVHAAEPEPHCLEMGSLHLDLNAAIAQTDAGCAQLTPNEFDLLKFLMQNPGHLFSTKQLLEDVWKYPPGTGDPALVRWHVRNVRLKIEPDPSQPIYLHTIPRHGYKLAPTSAPVAA
ncbi:MAG: response regulator transcription factor [Chloroflexi bacterium]|nr:response regulator transcription factor [Chloroflexota bacterium]